MKRKYEEPDMTISAGAETNNKQRKMKTSLLNRWERQREEILDDGKGKNIKYWYSEQRKQWNRERATRGNHHGSRQGK